jgi:hypothetical protein
MMIKNEFIKKIKNRKFLSFFKISESIEVLAYHNLLDL